MKFNTWIDILIETISNVYRNYAARKYILVILLLSLLYIVSFLHWWFPFRFFALEILEGELYPWDWKELSSSSVRNRRYVRLSLYLGRRILPFPERFIEFSESEWARTYITVPHPRRKRTAAAACRVGLGHDFKGRDRARSATREIN